MYEKVGGRRALAISRISFAGILKQEDGIVTVDEDRCRGYRFCQAACPYKKIYFNHQKKVAQKCIFCFPRIDEGVAPACARQCPGRIRFVGYRDDPGAPIHKYPSAPASPPSVAMPATIALSNIFISIT